MLVLRSPEIGLNAPSDLDKLDLNEDNYMNSNTLYVNFDCGPLIDTVCDVRGDFGQENGPKDPTG